MVASIVADLHSQHLELWSRSLADPPGDTVIADARELLVRLRSAGQVVDDPLERQRLESYASYWGRFLSKSTGEYPDICLEPTNADLLDRSEKRVESPPHTASLAFVRSLRHDFYRHIPLPPNYIPRPELLAEVRERLLAGTGSLALTSAIQVQHADVLHGMGGIGKSVLARALCDDPDVQSAFPDGILWATLGQTPDLIARLREWIETLGGVVGQTAPTLDQLRNTLAEALRDKACLLIVDDAWKKAHLEPFCAGGPRCRLLITTRDATLAEVLDAGVYPVPVMAPDQAVALLEEWAGGSLAQVEAEVKTKIVRRLGYLPLAVRLAGAQLRGKDPAEWLASFDARKLKTRRVEVVHDSLEANFALSLDALGADNRRLYIALAIFREDEPTPVAVVAKLWSILDGRDASATDELLNDLAARALLARSLGNGDFITIHDLLHDFMVTELSEEGRLAAHSALLEAYGLSRLGEGWHTAPNDGYLYEHLAYHLGALADHQLEAARDLRGLFADQGWLNTRVPASGFLYDGYLDDMTLAWSRAQVTVIQQIDAGQEPAALADCVRFVLIRTSINSIAANYAPELVAQAVDVGLWTTGRALSVLRRIPDPERKASMATALLKTETLTGLEREVALQDGQSAAESIPSELLRMEVLEALARYSTSATHEQTQQGRRAATRTIELDDSHARFPVSSLTGEALLAKLAAAQTIGDEWASAQALGTLATHLTGTARERSLEAGLAAAQTIDNEWIRGRVLARLVPHLTGRLLDAGLEAVLAINDERWRAHALAALVPHLPNELLQIGLTAARAIEDDTSRAHALAALVPQLAGAAREQTVQVGLAAARAIDHNPSRVRALVDLLPHLTGTTHEQAVQAVLTGAQDIQNEEVRAEVLVDVATYLTGADREHAYHAGLTATLTIRDERQRSHALARLAPQLPSTLLQMELEAAQAINDERWRAHALAALVPHLPRELLQVGLTAAQAIHDDESRASVLATLAPHLTGALLQTGLAAAHDIEDEGWRAHALAAFLAVTPDPTSLLRTVRRAMADYQWNHLQYDKRENALMFCAIGNLFKPPILDVTTLAAIAGHIIEICEEWIWL